MRIGGLIALFILLAASSARPCSLTTYYVDPGGNDGHSGSIGSPFLTIGHAISVATAGSTINVNSGTYPENLTFSSQSGTSGAGCNITVRSVTAFGAKVQTVELSGTSSFITIDGLDISNQTEPAVPNGYGIYLTGTVHDITLNNNYVHELCHEGIFADSTVGINITVSGGRIFKAQMTGININGNVGANAFGGGTTVIDVDISQTQQRPKLVGGIYAGCHTFVAGSDDADWIRAFGSGHTIGKPGHGNILHDIPHGTTANPTGANEPHTDCLQTFTSGLDHTIFEGNSCVGSDTAAHTAWIIEGGDIDGNGCGGCVNNVLFRNNIFANLNQGPNIETGWNTVRFLNNTFDHITQEGIIYSSAVDAGSDAVNNIFADVGNTTDGPIACVTSTLPTFTTDDVNMIRGGSQGTFCNSCTCPTGITTAPGFAANGNGVGLGADYRLCAASAVPVAGCGGISGIANSGTTLASFSNDKIGTARPQGANWAIGAFEEAIPQTQPGVGDGLMGIFQ